MTHPAAEPKVAEEVERAAFEAWVREKYQPSFGFRWDDDGDPRLMSMDEHGEMRPFDLLTGEWWAWQAAIARQSALVAATREEALREAVEAVKACWPRAHTYASENADLYLAQDGVAATCISAIRALLRPPSRAAEPKDEKGTVSK